MTQHNTPHHKVSHAQHLGNETVAFHAEQGGTINVQMFVDNQDAAIRGFQAPDASSPRLDQQMQKMQELGMLSDTALPTLDNARANAGIQMQAPPSALGSHTAKLQEQQMSAPSQDGQTRG